MSREAERWNIDLGVENRGFRKATRAGKLNVNLMRETWDEMLRLVASIKTGEVRASLIVGKLAAASRRNKLYCGLQEFERLIKTPYLAEYLRSRELRRKVLLV
jgi:TnpA family transposase